MSDMPQLSRSDLLSLRKTLDEGYRTFSREYGEAIEQFFDPLLTFLVWFEKLLIAAPWWLVIGVLMAISHLAARSIKLTIFVGISLFAVGYLGMWKDMMSTLSIITVCTLLSVLMGVPIGILMAKSNRMQAIVTPILDVMQTMPAFVYLIPVVMLLGIGKIPGLIAVVIYAIPPVIRLTNLGIRLVDKDTLEAADAYGANGWQKLIHVQLPLALPNIMAGINQTIMMAPGMGVIGSLIVVCGVGQPVLKSITNQYFTLGLLNGGAIVVLAIMFDRVSQAFAKRSQHYLGSRP